MVFPSFCFGSLCFCSVSVLCSNFVSKVSEFTNDICARERFRPIAIANCALSGTLSCPLPVAHCLLHSLPNAASVKAHALARPVSSACVWAGCPSNRVTQFALGSQCSTAVGPILCCCCCCLFLASFRYCYCFFPLSMLVSFRCFFAAVFCQLCFFIFRGYDGNTAEAGSQCINGSAPAVSHFSLRWTLARVVHAAHT